MRLFVAAGCLLWLFLAPYVALALGLGEIQLDSALNEPFAAEISLEAGDSSEYDGLSVTLASRSTFERYGLDRPAYLSEFEFAVKTDDNGRSYIELSSPGPVAEPFVTLLLDVKWSSGRLLREYTVLLDPPLFQPEAVQQSVVPAESVPKVETESAGEVNRSAYTPSEVVEPTGLFQESAQPSEPVVAKPDPQPEPVRAVPTAVTRPAPVAQPDGSYVAQKGDTLWRIAERVRGNTGLTNNQMMLALYRANPNAFLGNINDLKAGAILRVPEQPDTVTVSEAQAIAEVQQQHAAWAADAGEAQLELVAPSEDVATGEDARAGAVADGGQAQTEQLQSRLNNAEAELAESQRLLQLRNAELQALQERIADLEQSVEDAPVDAEEVADAEVVTDPAAADPAGIFADEELLVDEEAVDEPAEELPVEVVEPATDTAPVADEEPATDSVFADIWVWVGAAILLLLGLAVARRRKAASDENAWEAPREAPDYDDAAPTNFEDLPSNEDAIVVEEGTEDIFSAVDDAEALEEGQTRSGDAGPEAEPLEDVSDDFNIAFDTIRSDTGSPPDLIDEPAPEVEPDADAESLDEELEMPLERTISTGAPLNLDQADPIAEAEFHMAYGLYDQAADLLTRALGDEPGNRPYRVKLIEVFFVWENKEGFLEQAKLLRSAVTDENDSDWSKVLILGKQLWPDEELFAGESTASPTVDSMDLELTDAGETDIDFSLSGNEIETLDLGFPGADDANDVGDIDLDLGIDFGDDADADVDLTLDLGAEADDVTMESPTVDVEGAGAPTVEVSFDDLSASTMETPTLESPMFDPTVEIPAGDPDDDAASTMETPTLEVEGPDSATTEMPALDALPDNGDLNDSTGLDVDLSGLADFDEFDEEDQNPTTLEKVDDILDLAAAEDDAADAGSDLADELSGEVDDVLFDATNAADADDVEFSDLGATLALDDVQDGNEDEAGALFEDADGADAAVDPDNIDLDIGAAEESASDTAEQPLPPVVDGDTAEQPGLDVSPDVDIDIGGVEAETFVPDDATMTEVGTKLDLARAYIDMGDPEGARSILNEVLDEGGESQQQEARQLLEELSD
jgi:pilus assembly protein FimV